MQTWLKFPISLSFWLSRTRAGLNARPCIGLTELDLLGDDFGAAVLHAVFLILAIVNTSNNDELLALRDMFGDGFSQTVEAGDAVPFSILFGMAIFVDNWQD